MFVYRERYVCIAYVNENLLQFTFNHLSCRNTDHKLPAEVLDDTACAYHGED